MDNSTGWLKMMGVESSHNESTWHSMLAIQVDNWKDQSFVAAEWMRYNITIRSTRRLNWNPFIIVLSDLLECCSSARVISSVMSPLRIDTKLSTASPLLCNGDVDEIIERLVENGGSWINPWCKYMAFNVSYHIADWKNQSFVVAECMRYNITIQWTRLLDSFLFIVVW